MIKPRNLLLLLVTLSMPVSAGTGFRCASGKLAEEGDTKSEVFFNCGSPFFEEYVGLVKIRGAYVHLDRWTYDLGTGKLLKLLDFHDGILAEVHDGSRS